jgi:hypothetical protein
MDRRILSLLLLVILPGIAFSGGSAYYLFPDWSALSASANEYRRLANSPTSTIRELAIAEAAENRHRLNCFAEGIGVLVGWTILAIGIHALCTLPKRTL